MKHRDGAPEQDDLLRPRLVDMIDRRHALVKLAALIDWDWFEREWAGFFPSKEGRPATHPRLVTGLMYLQHVHRLSDDAVVARWIENPYFHHFTGETFFQHQAPVHASSLSRWRDRIGEEGAEWLLNKTIEAGRAAGAVEDDSLKRVAVDATVMEKNIAHPTDARLYEKARSKLVGLARERGLRLRQSYARKAPRLAARIGRYAHARQVKRMRASLPHNSFLVGSGGSTVGGIGDLDVFAAYQIDTGNPAVSFAIVPQVVAPIASDDRLGNQQWQLGVANVYFNATSPMFNTDTSRSIAPGSVTRTADRALAGAHYSLLPFISWGMAGTRAALRSGLTTSTTIITRSRSDCVWARLSSATRPPSISLPSRELDLGPWARPTKMADLLCTEHAVPLTQSGGDMRAARPGAIERLRSPNPHQNKG